MPKFNFRLETLLRLRRAERRRRRVALAEAYQADDLLQRQMEMLELEISDMQSRARVAVAPGKVDVDGRLQAHRYELVLKSRSGALRQQSQQLRGEIERRRQALIEADRQVRVLEKLRERQHDAHRADELRREIRQLDEFAQQAVRPETE